MKLTFRQSGGFAGLIRGCEVDTAELPASLQAELRQLLAAGKTEKPEGLSAARDVSSYKIVVEEPGGPRTLEFSDVALPAAAGKLVAFLQGRSKPQPPT